MEALQGSGRGSYIFGISVHNIRIERLWVDWTKDVGKTWGAFFCDLEVYGGLTVENPAHLWLLHHLFLNALNDYATSWVQAWNSHKMRMEAGEPKQLPWEMFTFGMLKYGPRGLDHLAAEEQVANEELGMYGVDWEARRTEAIVTHHAANNPTADSPNPFAIFPPTPTHFNEVVVEAPNSPLSPAQIAYLDAELARRVDIIIR
ncbi:hypothetical protein C8F01DRAFT_988416 [Mycena amicta]|nr:hypothetical protein C8F01DRAFT_988416 [Mycena amicta]